MAPRETRARRWRQQNGTGEPWTAHNVFFPAKLKDVTTLRRAKLSWTARELGSYHCPCTLGERANRLA